jgi:hypothetical protein
LTGFIWMGLGGAVIAGGIALRYAAFSASGLGWSIIEYFILSNGVELGGIIIAANGIFCIAFGTNHKKNKWDYYIMSQ